MWSRAAGIEEFGIVLSGGWIPIRPGYPHGTLHTCVLSPTSA